MAEKSKIVTIVKQDSDAQMYTFNDGSTLRFSEVSALSTNNNVGKAVIIENWGQPNQMARLQ